MFGNTETPAREASAPVQGPEVVQDNSVPELSELVQRLAPRAVELAIKNPELLAIGAVALVAYKRSPALQSAIAGLLGVKRGK